MKHDAEVFENHKLTPDVAMDLKDCSFNDFNFKLWETNSSTFREFEHNRKALKSKMLKQSKHELNF